MNYGFEYYKTNEETACMIMPEINRFRKKLKKDKYPTMDLGLIITSSLWSREINSLGDYFSSIRNYLIGPTKKEVCEWVGKDIYDQMVSLWANSSYHKLNKGDKIPIIKERYFVQDFLRSLKYRLDRDNFFPEEFYKLISEEMLDYYSINKRGDDRFDVLVSQEKKDLELLIKSEKKEPPKIEDIKTENKWIVK